MDIVYLAPSFIPSRSANSVHVMNMCEAFARQGHRVKLVAMRGRGEYSGYTTSRIFDFYGVKKLFKLQLIKVPVTRGAQSVLAGRTLFLLRRLALDNTLVYTRVLYGAVQACLLGFRVIYETHELPQNLFRWALERWLCSRKNLSKVVVVSGALRDLYKARIMEAHCAPPIHVAHDAANIPVFNKENSPVIFRHSGQAVLHLGYVGHLYPGRGIEVILAMAGQTPECCYHIIGGNEEDVSYWKRRQSENVFFYGYVEPNLVKYYIREMDVVLMPYQKTVRIDSGKRNTASWMSPMKMFEYMASRKPIISSDLTVLREILSDGVNGLLVKPDEVEAWVVAVEKMKSASLRQSLARRAFSDFTRYYTWDKRARDVLAGVA